MNYGKKTLRKRKSEFAFAGFVYRKRFLALVLKIILVAIILAAILLIWRGVSFSRELADRAPSMESIENPGARTTRILDTDGSVTTSFRLDPSGQETLSLDQMPQPLVWAFVDAVDPDFYSHTGIGASSMLRAGMQGFLTGNYRDREATITERMIGQYNIHAQEGEGASWEDFREQLEDRYLALKLEEAHDKDWILERYLNSVCLGDGIFGVSQGAAYYFDQKAEDLTAAQSAVLAAIAGNPLTADPLKDRNANQERQQAILSYMYRHGHLTKEDYQAAIHENVYRTKASLSSQGNAALEPEADLPAFDRCLKDALIRNLQEAGYREEEAVCLFYYGGLTIYSTQDSALGRACDQVIRQNGEEDFAKDGMLMVISRNTGEVRVLMEPAGQAREAGGPVTERRFTDQGLTDLFSVYAPLLDAGEYTLSDMPLAGQEGAGREKEGRITVREAIRKQDAGVREYLLAQSNSAGEEALASYRSAGREDADLRGLTGAELTAAFASVANGGTCSQPVFYQKVIDTEGTVLADRVDLSWSVMKETTAYLLADTLTEEKTELDSQEIQEILYRCGKGRGSWAIGCTPYYVCSVRSGSGAGAEAIRAGVSLRLHAGDANTSFAVPDGITAARICPVSGKIAIDGICPKAQSVSYVAGTQPGEKCDRHQAAIICTDSGLLISEKCPAKKRKKKVYVTDERGESGMPREVCSLHGR